MTLGSFGTAAVRTLPVKRLLSGSGRPAAIATVAATVAVVAMVLHRGGTQFGQTTINGVVSGVMVALAAVGVSLVYGVMRMINIAQAEFLTVGAFAGMLVGESFGMPIWVAVIAGTAGGAIVGGASEIAVWRPMRRRGSDFYRMLLMSLGLAFVLRYGLVLLAGNSPRSLDVDVLSTVRVGSLYIGTTQLVVTLVGLAALISMGIALRMTSVGKRARALADDVDLAETHGINANTTILVVWCVAGAMSGLAGVLYVTTVGQVTPYFGSALLLPIFAAVIVGGLGNAYGALAGGLLIGLVQEWSTIFIASQWKFAIGFAVLVIALILRPEGLLTRPSRRG